MAQWYKLVIINTAVIGSIPIPGNKLYKISISAVLSFAIQHATSRTPGGKCRTEYEKESFHF